MFRYRIYVEDNQYRYVFSDFVVKELWDAGGIAEKKIRQRGSVYTEDAKTKNFPLEEFIDRPAYHKSHESFVEGISNLRHQLKLAMIGEL